MKIVEGNLLDVKKGIICHQVNTYGVMGAGIAFAIGQKFPSINADYEKYCKKHNFLEERLLGTVLFATSYQMGDLTVANVFSQLPLGATTDLELIKKAFRNIFSYAEVNQLDVYIPYRYGSGIANGIWDDIVTTFLQLEKELQKEIIVVKLPN